MGISNCPEISEFMAANSLTLEDEDGNSSDWIEVHNPNPSVVSLSGYYLTDDPFHLTKWRFPNILLDVDEYLVVATDEGSAAAC